MLLCLRATGGDQNRVLLSVLPLAQRLIVPVLWDAGVVVTCIVDDQDATRVIRENVIGGCNRGLCPWRSLSVPPPLSPFCKPIDQTQGREPGRMFAFPQNRQATADLPLKMISASGQSFGGTHVGGPGHPPPPPAGRWALRPTEGKAKGREREGEREGQGREEEEGQRW